MFSGVNSWLAKLTPLQECMQDTKLEREGSNCKSSIACEVIL